ncbi:MAG: hypothetical protein PHQ27_02935 [Victivallales bacterium]|nr:hypothetical protein [Victivallales bacterium]
MDEKVVGDGEKFSGLHGVEARLLELFQEIFAHDGYGSLEVNIRFLKRGQKEILLRCGKEYRFVVDYPAGTSSHQSQGTGN